MRHSKLVKAALILLILVLLVVIIKFGKPLLMPLAFAGLLAMVLLPLTRWLEAKNINKAIATLLSVLVLVAFLSGLIALISWQASGVVKDASKIEQQVSQKYQQVRQFVSEKLGIPPEKQEQMLQQQKSSAPGKLASASSKIVAGIGGILASMFLVFIYIFLPIYFRGHIKRFILRLVKDDQQENARYIIARSQQVTQKYLGGYALMIIGLWIMYGIGFSIAGVKNAIFFAILCGVLEIVPFVGNLIGNALTILVTLVQGGGTNVIIGILVTYAVVQFIQSYILEPLVVGREVNINPLFTIVGLIAGELLWGIGGMVLAIPIMGVTKIICDHVEPLKPFGEFMGESKKKGKGFTKKAKALAGALKEKFTPDRS